MELVFLGTSCSTPAKNRNLSSMALKYGGEWFLFDCPEGAQMQMIKANISYMKTKNIFISHFHADHFLGLPGLIATMSLHERSEPLTIFGPRGIGERVNRILKFSLMGTNFPVVCKEVKSGKILEAGNYSVNAVKVKHDVECYGYVFMENDKEGKFMRKKAEKLGIPVGPLYSKLQSGESVKVKGKTFKPEDVMDYGKGRKGKKVSYIVDTLPEGKYFDAVKESDVLVHEASFMQDMKERAKKTMHSTAQQAGGVAKKCKVKRLVLTHMSPRYKKVREIENEAKKEFANSVAATDLMEISV